MARISDEARQKRSIEKLGDKNPMWKGDNVGYEALHGWVNRRLHPSRPPLCQKCFNGPALDLANVTG